jgi:hypothetical protein
MPQRVEVPAAQNIDLAPISVVPSHQDADFSMDAYSEINTYYGSRIYLVARPISSDAANLNFAMPDLPLADLQGIRAAPTVLSEVIGKTNINPGLENLHSVRSVAESDRPIEAAIGNVQLRMLGAGTASGNGLNNTMPAVAVPSVSGTGLLRR